MKIVGRVLLTRKQSFNLCKGGTIDLPIAQFREFIRHVVRPGDLAWVQEPFFVFTPKRMGYDTEYRPGPVCRSWHGPKVKRPAPLGEKRIYQEEGKFLARRHSTVTLEVMGAVSEGSCVRCLVHPENVDAFVKARRQA